MVPVTFRSNIDDATVAGFGREWQRFDQSELSNAELQEHFDRYFSIFPWEALPAQAEGFDLGCGSGRWARLVAPRVGRLHCIDASEQALSVARTNLAHRPECEFHLASVERIPMADGSQDFGYSLGVLHHIPDTQAALASCVAKLKPGAPFLVYLYYAFDNRPWWFRWLWWFSNQGRLLISKMPFPVKILLTQLIALTVYWPLARTSSVLERIGLDVANIPLSFYRNSSIYTLRTDALDRFGTRLEQRFSAHEITAMFDRAGLRNIRISENAPFYCAIGFKPHEANEEREHARQPCAVGEMVAE